MFNYLLNKERNPFRKQLYWECDDVRHGRCDWLEINELDTLATKANWHTNLNVNVNGWRQVENPEVLLDSTSSAFAFPRQSGAAQASYASNHFDLTTSRVKSVTLYLSPEMIDFKRPVRVTMNGKVVYHQVFTPDRDFMLANFKQELDHQAVWVNQIRINIP